MQVWQDVRVAFMHAHNISQQLLMVYGQCKYLVSMKYHMSTHFTLSLESLRYLEARSTVAPTIDTPLISTSMSPAWILRREREGSAGSRRGTEAGRGEREGEGGSRSTWDSKKEAERSEKKAGKRRGRRILLNF